MMLGGTTCTTASEDWPSGPSPCSPSPAALPAAAAEPPGRQEHPARGGLSAVVRYTEYGIPHIRAESYADLGFGTGWAQAADQVCVLADGFVTVRGERSRFFGPAGEDRRLAVLRRRQPLQRPVLPGRPAGGHGGEAARRTGSAGTEPAGQGPDAGLRGGGTTPGCGSTGPPTRPARGAPWVRPVTTLDVAARFYALSVIGGQGGAVDDITAAQAARRAARGRRTRAGRPGTDPGRARAGRGRGHGLERGRLRRRHHGERPRPAAGQPALPLAGRTPVLAGAADHPGRAGRRRCRAARLADRLHRLQLPGGVEPHGLHRGAVQPDPADPGSGRSHRLPGRRPAGTDDAADRDGRGRDGPPVTRTQWWTRYGPVVAADDGSLRCPGPPRRRSR